MTRSRTIDAGSKPEYGTTIMKALSVETVQKAALLVLAVLTAAAAGFFSLFIAWSVFAGGVVVLVNLWFSKEGVMQMANAVTAAVAMGAGRQQAVAGSKRRSYLLKFWLRILVTGIVLFVLIRWQLVDIFGLLVGLSTIFITTTALSFAVVVYYLVQRNQGRR